MCTLTLAELGGFLAERYTRDVLRLETRQRYQSASEQDGLQRYLAGDPPPAGAGDTPWIQQLRAHVAAGRSWRVLHAVTHPLSDYLRYECEWGYRHNAAAGQQIRITELDERCAKVGDLLIIDGRHIFQYRYDDADQFVDAQQITEHADVAAFLALAEPLWEQGIKFGTWWGRYPRYHRDKLAA